MSGYGPKIPFGFDKINGVTLTQTLEEEIRQNFKNLILTNPGERTMDANFGVGLKSYLFELDVVNLAGDIQSKILSQANTYMPYITIQKVNFNRLNDNYYKINIIYSIDNLNQISVLDFEVEI